MKEVLTDRCSFYTHKRASIKFVGVCERPHLRVIDPVADEAGDGGIHGESTLFEDIPTHKQVGGQNARIMSEMEVDLHTGLYSVVYMYYTQNHSPLLPLADHFFHTIYKRYFFIFNTIF